jgi:predicted AAA+ superfamily ATPase
LLIYQVNFYDTKNKSVLKTKCKYYAGDLGLLNSIIGYDINLNRGYRIENLVFLQLKSLDYEIYTSIDKNNHEIDFIIKKNNEIIYIQVAEILTDENFERESRSLLEVKDAFKKIIICKVDNVTHLNNTGIKIINLFE